MAKIPGIKGNRYDEILDQITQMLADLREEDEPVSMFAIVVSKHPNGGYSNSYYYLSQLEIQSLLKMSEDDFVFSPIKEKKDDCE
jgi:hypothetical protein